MLAAPQLVLYLTVMLLSMMILSFSTLTKAAMRMEASKTWVMSNFMLEGSPGEGKGKDDGIARQCTAGARKGRPDMSGRDGRRRFDDRVRGEGKLNSPKTPLRLPMIVAK